MEVISPLLQLLGAYSQRFSARFNGEVTVVVAATAAFEQLGIHAAAGQQINILIYSSNQLGSDQLGPVGYLLSFF